MITEEFVEVLQSVQDQFIWKLQPEDRWAPERRGQARLRLLAFPKQSPPDGETPLDPIGAVCYATVGTMCEPDDWQGAARMIGLSLICAADLIAATNERTWKPKGGDRQPDEYLESLRSQMIETVGLATPLKLTFAAR